MSCGLRGLQIGAYCFQISPRIGGQRNEFWDVSSVVKAFDIAEFETYLSNINQLETTSNVNSSFWLAETFAKRQQENLLRRFKSK